VKIKIICVGKVKDRPILSLCDGYSEKIGFDAKLETIEIKDSNPDEEGKRIIEILERIKENKSVFVLSEEGKEFCSVEFSEKMKKNDLDNKLLVFVIGGPFGLSQEAKKKADILLSLSRMTFTHEMARLFLLEQVYRALSIIRNKSYHK
jgi:23S rRNA (pseudouridine1915-N3)-methyltransferase